MDFLFLLSAICGWVYTLCWSASFYPQALLNVRRRSTSGTTIDYPFINVLGFAAYLASSAALLYSPTVRAQYAARHHGLAPTVQLNDVLFALHALVLSLITASQYFCAQSLWNFYPAPGTRPSRAMVGVATGCVLAVLATYALAAHAASSSYPLDPASAWCELDVVYAAGYAKLLITLVKYTPQVVVNARARSTVGWSISQVVLDLVGGFLSLLQLALDSYRQHDWSGVSGNPVKLALGNASMLYDSVFMVQHYVLYPHRADAHWPDVEAPLLEAPRAPDADLGRRRRLS
ncbi:hypothetical protein CDD82_1627 [Ophiocordyceps australis]|uniref:Cystinosin n=1 Tax=Ophiocordyceps australis TaxID=1399860 RepID=A0A2C5ZFC7_9HYPO|nr:hypothetical protein CDD82_1627 [Ophiocordyceps australis]